jgi:outer membrane protein assembly factor BamB
MRAVVFSLAAGLAAITPVCAASTPDSNWPQFRGAFAAGAGIGPGPVEWDVAAGRGVKWQTDIPGLGHACPVLWGDRVYIATAVPASGKPDLKLGVYGDVESYEEKGEQTWRLLALDKATGKVVWNKELLTAAPREPRHTKGSHCNSTPATDGRHLVAILGAEGMYGFDMEGRQLWKRDLGKMDGGWYFSPSVHWGFGSSPAIHNGRVYVQCDVLSERYIAAFDAADGRELWRTKRADEANYCTPTVAPAEGQLVVNGWKQIAGYDLADGKLLWTIRGGGDIPVPAPVVADGMAFLTSAHGKYRPLRAVRLDARGDLSGAELESTNAAVAWVHPRLGSYMQTPIVVGPLLFSCDWLGILSCVDTRTGRIHYSERLVKGGEAFTASPVAAGDTLYFCDESGNAYVVAAKPEFKVLAVNKLGAPCLATPAVSEGVVYFRTTEKLIAVGPKS